MKNIYLVGFMGSGKSTVGKLLADKTSRDFVDVDKLIEEREKMKIKDIFEKKGELYFRELEKKYLQELLNTQNLVVSTGGGLGADAENMNQMKKNGIVIWLDLNLNTILERIKNDENRPLLNQPLDKIKKLFDERKKVYGLATYRINAENKTPFQIVEEILNKIKTK
ncbi:shikimate kinase [Sulfurihydrogenibium azorense Az-Fu1]|jgi:shikimate kinase|uniref:Shikimate kinase n=2 Tax=Sulfurihydrogenibium azorense TaxID=309806 RepID=C1DXS1_SULAA|nr:shikimate kinase [Sulfurihydrogenibium azorense]ACN98971.1 shikimate kinase [Sulfurihydrogenibium azorense Az-Fu1]MDM7273449.1 shikimate kinase [Sulfurihydrogenibium azorense]